MIECTEEDRICGGEQALGTGCHALSPKTKKEPYSYLCLREKDHQENHVACGTWDHNFALWK